MPQPVQQLFLALVYYAALIAVMRLAGKRLAGQITPFDLVVLITLGVVLQQTALLPGTTNALVFVVTVFCVHRATSLLCARSNAMRRILRGAPRPLVRNGEVSFEALESENLSYDELLAGLRKLGHVGPESVRLATLEETGHISAVPMRPSALEGGRESVPPPYAPAAYPGAGRSKSDLD